MRASQEGHVAISKLLLNSGADVNRKNYEGMNALMLASQRGHADMVMLLITSGASMDEQTAQVAGYYINIYAHRNHLDDYLIHVMTILFCSTFTFAASPS